MDPRSKNFNFQKLPTFKEFLSNQFDAFKFTWFWFSGNIIFAILIVQTATHAGN